MVFIVVDEVSALVSAAYGISQANIERSMLYMSPLFSVPHTVHISMAFVSPEEASRRSPQAVQNTSDPMAAIITVM